MLTISQVAEKYNISNRQVQELVENGYLPVARLYRNPNKGVSYLFSEAELEDKDIYSLLAEMKDDRRNHRRKQPQDFKKLLSALNHYDRILENAAWQSEGRFIEICFYLFHLNHYAKTYSEQSNALYRLKNRVLARMYQDRPELMKAVYLLGPDRHKIWLCEDCKEAAHSAGLSYVSYVKNELYCPKCSRQQVEKEYFSLIEFQVNLLNYRFTFHLPLASASTWLQNIDALPQGVRETGRYDDKMYLYGRSISKIEEKVFPLKMIVEKLNQYLHQEKACPEHHDINPWM